MCVQLYMELGISMDATTPLATGDLTLVALEVDGMDRRVSRAPPSLPSLR